jgi:hypothetical protein
MPIITPPDKYDLSLDLDVNDFDAIRDILKSYDAIDDAESASPVTLDTPIEKQLF